MSFELFHGDAQAVLAGISDEQVRCCITSPPYFGLRDYQIEGQIGRETTPEEYVSRLVAVFREVRRVITPDGTLWLNLGDSYARVGDSQGGGNRALLHLEGKQTRMQKIPEGSGLKPKDQIGVPWMVAFALRADGWYLRQDIVWGKTNPQPESVSDRFTKAHEFVFLLSKSERYYFDVEAVKEPALAGDRGSTFTKGKTAKPGTQSDESRKNSSASAAAASPASFRRQNGFQDRWDNAEKPELRRKRDVWMLSSTPYKKAHFACMPTTLVEPCVLAGSAPGDLVLDPFCGSGTVGAVALRHGRKFVGIDLNPEYLGLAAERISGSRRESA